MAYLVGICGGSGSGKSTLANKLMDLLGSDAALISHDDYYKHLPGMTAEERIAYNFDVPDALDTHLLVEDLRALRDGRAADIPVYDFSTQTRKDQPRHLNPVPVVIVEGILVFHDEELRKIFDLSIFVDVDADVRVLRRIVRDCNERNHVLDGAVSMYLNNTRPAHEVYVEPYKKDADLIVNDARNDAAVNAIVAGIRSAAGLA